jgi:hypothetical protein
MGNVTIDRVPTWARLDKNVTFVVDGAIWWSNSEIMLRIDPSAGLTIGPDNDTAAAVLAAAGGEEVRPSATYEHPAEGDESVPRAAVVMNGGVYQERYVALVQALYPGATWRAPPGMVARAINAAHKAISGASATHDGRVWAVLAACTRQPPRVQP